MGDNAVDARDPKCTCHPEDRPPLPCPRKHALTDCRRHVKARQMATALARLDGLDSVISMPGHLSVPNPAFEIHVTNRMPEALRILTAFEAMTANN